MKHLSAEELQAGLDGMDPSPRDNGVVELIVRRPAPAEREVLKRGQLDKVVGLVGDNWSTRGSSKTEDGLAHPGMQLTLMNARVIAVVAGPRERWPLAGDQLFVDLDLSAENLPPGTRLKVGSAEIEVSAVPHTGCKKFVERFGLDAFKIMGSEQGVRLSWRGLNALVVTSGEVGAGDFVRKVGRPAV